MSENKNSMQVMEVELEERITELLSNLGMPRHVKGFYYLRRAIIISLNCDCDKIPVTKVLYPSIAKEFNTTGSRVERAIRHAIEISWCRADIKDVDKLFGNTVSSLKGKPTNSEFIALITDKLRLELKKANT